MKSFTIACMMLCSLVTAAQLPEPTWDNLPQWKGFNLLERFYLRKNPPPFQEQDFKLISELGFNFVRLPMDYRFWIKDNNWELIDENELKAIDQALEYGRKYNIHVSINFHRAPGYTVATPRETKDLWTNEEAQRVCAMHWATFARRYKDIPNKYLSFNLFNEPPSISADVHYKVVKRMVDAIRAESPHRLIICDGRQYGNSVPAELLDLKVAGATRGYQPMNVSHYKASWAGGETYPMPTWPLATVRAWIAGTSKMDLKTPVVINTTLKQDAVFRFKIGVVSNFIELKLLADGKEIWNRTFKSGPGKGEWEKEVFAKQWNLYQNIFNLNVEVPIPAGTQKLELISNRGDWMTFSEMAFKVGDNPEIKVPIDSRYGYRNTPITFDGTRWYCAVYGRQWHYDKCVKPWADLKAKGMGVMVGEFGAFNKTPHDVTLAWMEDCLKNWKQENMGWALWNFRGSFGILNSERKDVEYEDFHGHKLDRKMLDLLLKYK